MHLWKALGVAGLAGVAAAGVIIAREQRQRTQLTPEEIRARLQERLAQMPAPSAVATVPDAAATPPARWWRWLSPVALTSTHFRRRVGRYMLERSQERSRHARRSG